MNYLVTFSDHRMTQSKDLCISSALKHGVDNIRSNNENTIGQDFKDLNRDIWGAKRGPHYWIWKPYVIYKCITEPSVQDGDIIIYADAGIEFVDSVRHIIDRMDEDMFLFTNGFPHVEWCKRDALAAILNWGPWTFHNPIKQIHDTPIGRMPEYGEITDYKQVQASCIFIKVNDTTRKFIKEWLLYCQMPGFIDDSPSMLHNYPTFAEHRHDQAILTCLQIKYGYKLHFWPTNYSEHIRHTAQPNDNYPTLFNHHRKRNHGQGDGDAEW